MAVAEGDTSQEATRGYEAVSVPGSTARAACIALPGAGRAVLPRLPRSPPAQPLAGRPVLRCPSPGTDIPPPPQGPCTGPSLAEELD